VRVEDSLGRRHPERPHSYRNDFQRDRDRVVHARAFRRLEAKTQVFTRRYSDHFRNRLTHTIEVAQISRTIAAQLGLNTELAEALALVHDLGRPERFLNMLRTFKLTSPMSVGSWILSAFSAGAGVAAAAEVDRMTGERLPLGPLRRVLRAVEGPAGLEAAAFAPLLAVYTAVLLGDTSTPTWNAAHEELPFVFVSSASLAASGLAMVTTPVAETAPARRLAVLGVIGDLLATRIMHRRMDPVAAEPLHEGRAGQLLRLSEALAVAGGIGTLLGGRRRGVAVASGLALVAASALTRFGIFEAGIHSAKDPRYTIEPQKRRLAARRAAGATDDSITTVG